mmetsp:Transcript_21432/g.59855  ORF Transcript_21432/g.59855 Transcript_21432/m.59855 type:complete len:84 (+) Transcript_21432:82-333(+)
MALRIDGSSRVPRSSDWEASDAAPASPASSGRSADWHSSKDSNPSDGSALTIEEYQKLRAAGLERELPKWTRRLRALKSALRA